MEPLRLYVFANEVHTQVKGALWAFNGFHVAQPSTPTATSNPQGEHLFHWLTVALVYSANVSKLFWGDKKTVAQRRAPLRAHFSVTDASPLASRTLRNHYEHIDARLDDWFTNSPRQNFIRHVVGSLRKIVGIDPRDVFQHWDNTTGVASFRCEDFALPPMQTELQRLARIPLPPPPRGSGPPAPAPR